MKLYVLKVVHYDIMDSGDDYIVGIFDSLEKAKKILVKTEGDVQDTKWECIIEVRELNVDCWGRKSED